MSVSRYDLLRVFVTSRENSTAVGIRIRGRQTLLITTLEEISGSTEDDTIIRIHDESIYGEPVESHLRLDDVETISNLRIGFHDPFYVYLRSLRNNIRNIRQEVGFEKALS